MNWHRSSSVRHSSSRRPPLLASAGWRWWRRRRRCRHRRLVRPLRLLLLLLRPRWRRPRCSERRGFLGLRLLLRLRLWDCRRRPLQAFQVPAGIVVHVVNVLPLRAELRRGRRRRRGRRADGGGGDGARQEQFLGDREHLEASGVTAFIWMQRSSPCCAIAKAALDLGGCRRRVGAEVQHQQRFSSGLWAVHCM